MQSIPTTIIEAAGERDASELGWDQLPPLPDLEGFAASFAGVSGGALIVGGGANFPDRRPWAGGAKVWHDGVFVLERPDGEWKNGFHLPRPVAYGVSITTRDGVICIGGGDATRHFDDVVRLRWDRRRLVTSVLPRLPKPCAFMCGALVGGTIYLAGGIEKPDAVKCLHTFWALDLNATSLAWRELEPWPGPARMLGVAGSVDGSFFMFSGARLTVADDGAPFREYLRDAWRYTPTSGWRRLADMPRAAVAAPSPAPRQDGNRLLVISGDDGARVGFSPPEQHPGFPHSILAYDPSVDHWLPAGTAPISRATVPTVEWSRRTLFVSGEVVPGYRSPSVWSLKQAGQAWTPAAEQVVQWAMTPVRAIRADAVALIS